MPNNEHLVTGIDNDGNVVRAKNTCDHRDSYATNGRLMGAGERLAATIFDVMDVNGVVFVNVRRAT